MGRFSYCLKTNRGVSAGENVGHLCTGLRYCNGSMTLTGTFMWVYVAIGLLAVLLGFLAFLLPIEGAKSVGISTQNHA